MSRDGGIGGGGRGGAEGKINAKTQKTHQPQTTHHNFGLKAAREEGGRQTSVQEYNGVLCSSENGLVAVVAHRI